MKLTDAAMKAARDAALSRWVTGSSDTTQMLLSVDAALVAALAHLTDDGAAATPRADTGVRSTPAAESATPVGAGAAAPSSPRAMATATSLFEHQRHRSPHPGCAWCPDVPGEGATPAIDPHKAAGAAVAAIVYNLPIDGFGDERRLKDYARIWGNAAAKAVVALIEGAQ